MNAIIVAINVLQAVLNKKQSLNEALPQALSHYKNQQDHALIKALSFGVCRWYFQLSAIAKQLLKKPLKAKDNDLYLLILLGLFQLQHMRIPAHAAVNNTVSSVDVLKKSWAKGLVNAVLRNFQRREAELLQAIDKDVTAAYSHPTWLVEAIKTAWPAQWQTILHENNQQAPMSLRVNLSKISREDYFSLLAQENIAAEQCDFNDCGITLQTPSDVLSLPQFAAGFVSVQDCAAQLAARLLHTEGTVRVLDACSAPGGKAAHLYESNPEILLTTIEQNPKRLETQQQTFERLQVKAISVCADAADTNAWWDKQLFDYILLDAPCSASGVIRRHPDIKHLRKPDDINNLAQQQLRLLKALWPLLKPNGCFLYATCSIFPAENNEVIETFLQQTNNAKPQEIKLAVGMAVSVGHQILPGEHAMDGFYYALLRKS